MEEEANNNTIIAATALGFLLNAKNVARKSRQPQCARKTCVSSYANYTHTHAQQHRH